MPIYGRELRSTLLSDGTLRLSLEEVAIPEPAADEVVIRVEAAPINPSDLIILVGPADLTTAAADGAPDRPALSLRVPQERLAAAGGRLGEALRAGNEGAGTVVAAGAEAKSLEGRPVATFAGGLYADYVKVRAADVVPLPPGVSPADAAAIFVNPLTALGIVETAKTEGHRAMVHTAAASNVGRMVQRICLDDGYPVINVVRSQEQVEILKGLGAAYALNSRDENFETQLLAAVSETQATVAFDPIGGGLLGDTIMRAMERAAVARMPDFNRYGSSTFKQLYLYGGLDPSPVVLNRIAYGSRWSVASWFLTVFLEKSGPDGFARLIQRVLQEVHTTFASHYTRTIGLAEALNPDVLRAYAAVSTGGKYLLDPTQN